MRYEHSLLLPVLLMAFLGACKKDEVNEAPHVTITSPYEGSSLSVPDTLLVTVEARDDYGLEQISVTLLDQNNIPVVNGVGTSASGTSTTVTLALPIISEHLVSGDYKILATATDGELSGKDVRTLHVSAVPLRLRAVFTLAVPGSGTVVLYKTDSTGQTALAATWPMDLGGAAISPAVQLLYVAGGATGDMRALAPDDLNPVWERPNLSAIGEPWFTSVDLCADGRLYIGEGDGTLRSFTANNGTGMATGILPDQFRSQQAITSGDFLVCTERHFVSQEERIGIYFPSSGVLAETQPLDLAPIRIFTRDADHILIFGNRDGQGHVQDRSLSGGGGWEPYSWSSPITAVEQVAAGTWLVALANGDLQRFTYANAGSLSLGTTPVLNTLAFDEVNGWVYGGADGQVILIDPGTGSMTSNTAVNGSVRYVLPLYNR